MTKPDGLITLLLKLLFSDKLALIDFLFDLLQRLPLVKSLPGMYEVLNFKAELELKDDTGQTAVYSKTQSVRFIQDNIIAYQDTAWGDGDIFANYKCSPGVEVDRYQEGDRYNILISLRETMQRNDTATIQIERTINDGFLTETESFQVDIDHRTRALKMSVVFPQSRPPKKVTLIEQNSTKSVELSSQQHQLLPDGRHQYTWATINPKLFESFIMRWQW